MKSVRTALLVIALGIVNVLAADIRQGLVAYWRMEGLDGLNVPDETPFSNHMRTVNIAAGNFVPGQFGNAVQLNGTSTFMTNLHPSDPSITGLPIYKAGSYTITMWVKGGPVAGRYLYSEANTNSGGTTAGQNPIVILQTGQTAATSNKFDVIIRNDAGTALVNHRVSTNVVFDNNWHHIAWVDDRGSVRLYIDGNLDPANFSYTPAGNFSLNTSTIGALTRATVGGYFNGQIDDVGLWRRALSAAEVQEVRTNSLMTPIPAFPPTITSEPVGSTNRVGDRVTISAAADGNPPLAYQWLKDGLEVPGATATALSLSSLTTGDSGGYALRVTNAFGSITSSVATLYVIPDPTPDLRAGIVSWWAMDEVIDDGMARGMVPDPYGSNNLRTVGPGDFIELTGGQFNTAIQFNGQDQYGLRTAGFPIYNNSEFSVAFWVNASAAQADRRIFAESFGGDSTSTFSLGSHTNGVSGTLRVLIRDDVGRTVLDRNSTRAILDDTWHHVVWTERNGEVRLFIDGMLDETSFNYPRRRIVLDTTTIGGLLNAAGATNFLNGLVDDAAVWSRALSFTEVQELRTNSIPAPLGPTAPTVTAHPISQSVFTRAIVTFCFAASGTGPLSWNWRKDGTDLPSETNATLTFESVTLANAGNYDVVVSNSLGTATSQVAVLTVTLRPITTDLKIDFNNLGADDTPANTEPGFASFTLDVSPTPGPVTRAYGGAEVTVWGVGGISLQSRKRTQPTNMMDFTEERLLQDFIFSPDTALGQGIDVAIDYLEPDQPYALTVWSYDNSNNGRFSDWSVNGIALTNGYTFTGSTLPTNNATHRFTFPVTADSTGRILIQGRRGASASSANNVFLNAFRVAVPPLPIRVQTIELTTTNTLRLVISGINPAATHRIEQKTTVTDAAWVNVPEAVFSAPSGNTIEAIVPVPDAATRFYQVVETP